MRRAKSDIVKNIEYVREQVRPLNKRSDNLIFMTDVSATEAARNFADLLDGVEHRGERYRIVRRGKAVARLEPVTQETGKQIKEILSRRPKDGTWSKDLAEIRGLLEVDSRH